MSCYQPFQPTSTDFKGCGTPFKWLNSMAEQKLGARSTHDPKTSTGSPVGPSRGSNKKLQERPFFLDPKLCFNQLQFLFMVTFGPWEMRPKKCPKKYRYVDTSLKKKQAMLNTEKVLQNLWETWTSKKKLPKLKKEKSSVSNGFF